MGKYRTIDGSLAIASTALFLTGCGGGGRPTLGGSPGGSRVVTTTRFDVDVKTGDVAIAPVDPQSKKQSRAVMGGGSVEYSSTRLAVEGGSPGRRTMSVTLRNRSGEQLSNIKVQFSAITSNSGITDLRTLSTVSLSASTGHGAGVDGLRDIAPAPDGALILAASSGNQIWRVTYNGGDPTSSGSYSIAVIAGTGTAGATDGAGNSATLYHPNGIAVDHNGIIYVGEGAPDFAGHGNRLRRIYFRGGDPMTASNYQVTPVAGDGTLGTDDGTGAVSTFTAIQGMAIDPDQGVLVVDNDRIRRVSLSGGDPGQKASYNVATIATTIPAGTYDIAYDFSHAAAWLAGRGDHVVARLGYQFGDRNWSGSYNYAIIAGGAATGSNDGTGDKAHLNSPSSIAVDGGGNVYVADDANYNVRRIRYFGTSSRSSASEYAVETIAGTASNGSATSGTTNGTGDTALFQSPLGMCSGPDGALFFTENSAGTVRRIATPPTSVSNGTDPAGNTGTAYTVSLINPSAVLPRNLPYIDYGTISDSDQNTVRWAFDVPAGVNSFSFTVITIADTTLPAYPQQYTSQVRTVAGSIQGYADGPVATARFNGPRFVAAGEYGAMYVSDTANHCIRRIDPYGPITTIAGRGGVSGSANGATGDLARFNSPQDIVFAGIGVLYVADAGNCVIKRISLISPIYDPTLAASWRVDTIAGTGSSGTADGAGNVATFTAPSGLAARDPNQIFVSDSTANSIRRISFLGGDATTASNYTVSTLATGLSSPTDVTMAADGTLYVADSGNNRIAKVTAGGTVSAYATGLSNPVAVDVDNAGTLYISNRGTVTVLRYPVGGSAQTLAGSSSGSVDGVAPSAKFGSVCGIVVSPTGTVYVADDGNHLIRSIERTVTTGPGLTTGGL